MSKTRSVAGLAVLVCLACVSGVAVAQDLSPRAYVITPVDSNAVVVSYSHLAGGVQFAGALPITGAESTINLGVHTPSILLLASDVSFSGR